MQNISSMKLKKLSDVFVYGLIDPRTGEIRYIGQTSVGLLRPKRKHTSHCRNWELNLEKIGLKKQILELDHWDGFGDYKKWLDETETFYISYFKMIGANLTNLSIGGEGRRGFLHSQETKEKISLSLTGKRHSLLTKEKISNSHKGIMTWNKGKKTSTETRLKQKRAHIGIPLSKETKLKMSRARFGKVKSLETRKKISESLKKYRSKIEEVANQT